MRRVFLYSSLVFCMFTAPAAVAHAEGDGGGRTGLLSGVLEKVESTVTETTESVGEVVGNVVPVVENTAETVQTATSAVTGVVAELPEVPVVTPVLDEVSKVANEITETVSESVKIGEVEKAGDLAERINKIPRLPKENVTPMLLQEDDRPATHEQSVEASGQPVFDSNIKTQDIEMVSTIDSPEVPESTEPILDENTNFIPNETPQETAVSAVNRVVKVEMVKEEAPAKQEIPAMPIQSSTQWEGIPIAVTTGTTSVASPISPHAGYADIVAGVVDGFAVLRNLTGRQWVHSDEEMRVQWVHAPPGQPPQSTPFLQVKK